MFSAFLAALVALIASLAPAGALDAPTADSVARDVHVQDGSKMTAREELRLACSSIGIEPASSVPVAEKKARALLDSVPSSVGSRLINDQFTDFPSRPALRVEPMIDRGKTRRPNIEAPGLAHAVLPGMELVISANENALQVLASTSETGRTISLAVKHTLTCQGADGLRIDVLDEGVAIDLVDEVGGRYAIAWVGKPWAVDATGKELRTWFEADGDVLRQFVDTEGAVGPVTFDPTYSFMNCWGGHYSDLTGGHYLDIPANDPEWCPVLGMFEARNGYRPVLGFETNVANDYGKIALRESGGCSWSPDTGPSWDFQVPCKAHDYCYDLRKAGFSGTVTDENCDEWFFWIMEAHCNDRVLAGQCRSVRDNYYAAVIPAVTDPDPAGVEFQASHSAQCLDVEGSSLNNNARVLQFHCNRTANQLFKITPAPGEPGLFQLKPTHSI